VYFAHDPYDTLEGADALAIVTEWSEFRNPDFEKMAELMAHPAIFDGRNVYTLNKMEKLGFYYQSIGRRTIRPSAPLKGNSRLMQENLTSATINL
jgi:UDPglucose 6-dehydrogenase